MNREPYQGPQGGPPPPPGPVNQATPRASDTAAKMLYNCAGNYPFAISGFHLQLCSFFSFFLLFLVGVYYYVNYIKKIVVQKMK